MDVQLPSVPSAGNPSLASTQSPARVRQGESRLDTGKSGKAGKSFSSELRAAKESHRENNPSHSDHAEDEASPPSNDATASSQSSSCNSRDGHCGDSISERPRADSEVPSSPVANETTMQSVLLGLIVQPLVIPNGQIPTQNSSGDQINTATESVMTSVMEDGTSLPDTAADSSTLQQTVSPEITAQPSVFMAAIPSGAVLPSAGDAAAQPSSPAPVVTMPTGQVQPTPEELRALQQEQPTVPLTREEQLKTSEKVEGNSQPVVLTKDQQPPVQEHYEPLSTATSELRPRSEEPPPVVTERPVQALDASEPKEEKTLRHQNVVTTAWQDAQSQNQEGGMEWSGRDQRERQSGEPIIAQATLTEASLPATPSNSPVLTNGVDQRVFSSAPSNKVPAETPPATPAPPAQPTDWMPANSTHQTKSIVLELSQADLGRMNIRIAVNQDVVHTQFTSDRTEMGQYLVSGQEKLQSALQTSGLDLGQFRVDIDRQSAGRSFQHSASQDQSQGRSSQDERQNQGQVREEFTRGAMPRRGVLNLVA